MLRKASSAWVNPRCEEGRLDVAHREVIASMSPRDSMKCVAWIGGIIAILSANEQLELST